MDEEILSGMRHKPSLELLQKVVDIFLPKQKISESFDIYLNRINKQKVIEDLMAIFPEIELIYYPSKLYTMLHKKEESSAIIFNFETSIQILRQFLRANNYIVKTKTIKRKDTIHRIMSVFPPENIIINKEGT